MMEDNKILKLVYTFFLGLLIAVFVGVGISTFYETPEAPEYPLEAEYYEREPTSEELEAQKQYDEEYDEFVETNLQPYNRNVSIIVIIAAVMLLALSIIYDEKLEIISDGVMLGGLFTLMYGIGRGFASENTKYVFVIVTVSLGVVLYLGHNRFISKEKTKKSRK